MILFVIFCTMFFFKYVVLLSKSIFFHHPGKCWKGKIQSKKCRLGTRKSRCVKHLPGKIDTKAIFLVYSGDAQMKWIPRSEHSTMRASARRTEYEWMNNARATVVSFDSCLPECGFVSAVPYVCDLCAVFTTTRPLFCEKLSCTPGAELFKRKMYFPERVAGVAYLM